MGERLRRVQSAQAELARKNNAFVELSKQHREAEKEHDKAATKAATKAFAADARLRAQRISKPRARSAPRLLPASARMADDRADRACSPPLGERVRSLAVGPARSGKVGKAAAGKAARKRQAASFRRLHAPARSLEQAGAELADDGAHRLSKAERGERQLGNVFAVIRQAIHGKRTLYGQTIQGAPPFPARDFNFMSSARC